jgi:hypothetical protein
MLAVQNQDITTTNRDNDFDDLFHQVNLLLLEDLANEKSPVQIKCDAN